MEKISMKNELINLVVTDWNSAKEFLIKEHRAQMANALKSRKLRKHMKKFCEAFNAKENKIRRAFEMLVCIEFAKRIRKERMQTN